LKHPCIATAVARRKRKDEAPEWSPPEFDEVGYMRQEIAGAKVAIATVAWAGVGAIISYLLYLYVHPLVAFLVGLAVFGALSFVLPMLGVRTQGFKRRDWLGHGVTYFFSWLAFWILLLNPPFGDHTAPTLWGIEVGSYSSTGGSMPAANSVACTAVAPGGSLILSVGSNDTLFLLFRATDNVAVTSVRVSMSTSLGTSDVNATLVEGQPNACLGSGTGARYAPGTYAVHVPIAGSSYFSFQIEASDRAGLIASTTVRVNVQV